MKLRISITVQSSDLPETPVFESDLVSPETVSSTLAIAERTAVATIAAAYADQACIREYLGPTLIATFHSKGEHQKWRLEPVQFVRITNKLSGKVLDVSNLSTCNGAVIQQWDYQHGSNQEWHFVFTDGESCRIMNRLSAKVLDVTGASKYNGALIQQWAQWDYLGGEGQKWQLVPVDTGYYRVINKLSGKALAVANSSKEDGALIQQWDYLGHDNQKWQITRVPAQYSRLGVAA
jgi:hypothetical protein